MKTTRHSQWIFILFLAAGFNSCIDDFSIDGNGEAVTENRWTTTFNEVKVSGSYEVLIVQGDDYSVEITAESNLQPYIITDIDGGKLKVRTQGIHNLHNTLPMMVYITTPHLDGLQLNGAGSIQTDTYAANRFKISISGSGQIETSIDADKLDAEVSGSGKIYVSGHCERSNLVISGSGKIKSYDLEQRICNATISGSGDMYVNAAEQIDVKISGSGDLLFINYPKISSSISGSGRIINDN